ncbi:MULTISPECIES: hypothetical protein [Lactococcus]|uniref:hypothetical protein n=1 Tax=Lactococcus TaxID=1357 RepID=UPI001D05F819|nr:MULTISPECIES: hypothetical protein [Lactococcus]MCB6852906.1 hypothetical protein [Lactococcus lactis]MCT0503789.1 hypothetical protein [Lactococcus cremoris]
MSQVKITSIRKKTPYTLIIELELQLQGDHNLTRHKIEFTGSVENWGGIEYRIPSNAKQKIEEWLENELGYGIYKNNLYKKDKYSIFIKF